MVKRYSVSVSDELAAKIDKWKKSISVSQVFQEAMEKVVSDKEAYISRLDDDDDSIEAIAMRLRREKSLEDRKYYTDGKNVGFEWAKKASYREICLVLAQKEELDDQTNKTDSNPNIFKGIITKILKGTTAWDNIVWHLKYKSGPLPAEAVQWLTGWVDGVGALWSEVKDKI